MASAELWRCSKASERCASRRRARRRRGAKRTNDAPLPRRRARRSPRTSSRCCRTHRVNSSTRSRARAARGDGARPNRARGRAAARTSEGELDPKDVVALIAVHALERCTERSSSDGERAFLRAAKRFETVARVCSARTAVRVPPAVVSSSSIEFITSRTSAHHRAPRSHRVALPVVLSLPLALSPLQSSHESIQTIDCTFKPNICS